MLSFVLSLLLSGLLIANGDEGSGLDPHGGTRISSARCGDDGSGLDPHGAPCTTSTLNTDDGNGFDPHG